MLLENTAGSYKITFGVTAKDSAENSSVSGDENGVFKETWPKYNRNKNIKADFWYDSRKCG